MAVGIYTANISRHGDIQIIQCLNILEIFVKRAAELSTEQLREGEVGSNGGEDFKTDLEKPNRL